jgi:hypothetical protein
VREIRTLRAMWRALETGPRQFLNGARRGKPRIHAKEEPTGHRASARPYPVGHPSITQRWCARGWMANLLKIWRLRALTLLFDSTAYADGKGNTDSELGN